MMAGSLLRRCCPSLFLLLAACIGSTFCVQESAESERELLVAVKQRNEHLLAPLLASLSTPASATYGQHLSLPALCELIAPHPDHLAAVAAWAEAHGATQVRHSACGEFVTVRIASSRIPEAMRGTPSLECSAEGCDRAAAVPPALAHAADFVEGLGGLRRGAPRDAPGGKGRRGGGGARRSYSPGERRRQRANDRRLASRPSGAAKKGPWYPDCLALSAVPSCLKRLHNVTARASAGGKASQGVALFGPQYYSPSDLSAFQKAYNVTPNVVRDLNGNKPASPGTEATLDVEYITGIGAGVETWYMHWACTTNDCKPFLTWMLQVANMSHPPAVQSVSVGTTEYEYVTGAAPCSWPAPEERARAPDPPRPNKPRTHSPARSLTRSPAHSLTHSLTRALTHSLTRSLAHSLTHPLAHSLTRPLAGPRNRPPAAAEMGAKHVARMNAEFAKAGVRGISLVFASGDRASQVYDGKFWVNFPSGSPHVTAVGGVWLGVLGNGPLVADPDTTGGFSNCEAHARMAYQDAAVERYLSEAAEEGAAQPKAFNASNRGVPDLVSMSDAYVIVQRGAET